MPESIDTTAIEAHIRKLDEDELAAFVTDLWERRGYRTIRDGDVVVATRNGQTEVLLLAIAPSTESCSNPSRQIDGIIAPRDQGTATSSRDRTRIIDAANLREMLLYAIDRQDATALSRRHFGAALEELRAPLRIRLVRRISAPAFPQSQATLVALLVVLVGIGGAVFYATGGFNGLGGQRDPQVPATTPDSAPPQVSFVNTTPQNEPLPPPGVTTAGIRDTESLGNAHDRILENESYTLQIVTLWPRDGTVGPRGGFYHGTNVMVAGDRYYLTTTVEESGETTLNRYIYHDGSEWYVLATRNGTVSERYVTADPDEVPPPNPFEVRRTLVTRYLSTPETEFVDRGSDTDPPGYRVVGRGLPSEMGASHVRNYTAIALIDEQGMVQELTVEYTSVTDRTTPIANRIMYDRVGEVALDPPSWYERHFSENTTLPSNENRETGYLRTTNCRQTGSGSSNRWPVCRNRPVSSSTANATTESLRRFSA